MHIATVTIKRSLILLEFVHELQPAQLSLHHPQHSLSPPHAFDKPILELLLIPPSNLYTLLIPALSHLLNPPRLRGSSLHDQLLLCVKIRPKQQRVHSLLAILNLLVVSNRQSALSVEGIQPNGGGLDARIDDLAVDYLLLHSLRV